MWKNAMAVVTLVAFLNLACGCSKLVTVPVDEETGFMMKSEIVGVIQPGDSITAFQNGTGEFRSHGPYINGAKPDGKRISFSLSRLKGVKVINSWCRGVDTVTFEPQAYIEWHKKYDLNDIKDVVLKNGNKYYTDLRQWPCDPEKKICQGKLAWKPVTTFPCEDIAATRVKKFSVLKTTILTVLIVGSAVGGAVAMAGSMGNMGLGN